METTPPPSIEVNLNDLGPAGIKGELHVLAILKNEHRRDKDRLLDRTERPFKVFGLLSKNPPATGNIKGNFDENDGGSYLAFPDAAAICEVECNGEMFQIKKNSVGEKSLLAYECVSKSVAHARRKFQATALPLLDHFSYISQCPIIISELRIEDVKNDHTTIEYVSPYRKTTIGTHATNLYSELAPIYSMYREAKNSFSSFYKFLCYYKILEGLLGDLRSNVFKRAKTGAVELDRPRNTIPASPHISPSYSSYVGKSVKKFFDEVLNPQFRNSVAHFMTDDGSILNMSDPKNIEKFDSVLHIMELCVHEMINSHQNLLASLNSGVGYRPENSRA